MATKPAVAVVIAPAPTAPAPRTITLNVTDPDIIAEIDAWEDDEDYTFNVTQTAKNTFEVNEAFAAEPEESESEEVPETPANGENPAIAALLRK